MEFNSGGFGWRRAKKINPMFVKKKHFHTLNQRFHSLIFTIADQVTDIFISSVAPIKPQSNFR
jgi:hypothetical protein